MSFPARCMEGYLRPRPNIPYISTLCGIEDLGVVPAACPVPGNDRSGTDGDVDEELALY